MSEPDRLVGGILADRYRILAPIGEGAMGRVYLAEHTIMRKRVAVKVIHRELTHLDEIVARFEREAVASASMEHPNAVVATDCGKTADGALYLVMEHVDGRSLRDVVTSVPMPAERACRIVRQVLAALGRAHALGIVHRDIKPENIKLVTRGSDPDFVKVLDFGIAKLTLETAGTSPLTQLGMVYGTPQYLSPEQASGRVIDARADLYSVGVLLYEMLAGRRPFESDNPVQLMAMHLAEAPRPPSELAPDARIAPELERIVLRLLEKDPAQRFGTAEAVLEALDRLLVPPGSGPPALGTEAFARTQLAAPSAHGRGAVGRRDPLSITWREAADVLVREGSRGIRQLTVHATERSRHAGRRLTALAAGSPRRAALVVGCAVLALLVVLWATSSNEAVPESSVAPNEPAGPVVDEVATTPPAPRPVATEEPREQQGEVPYRVAVALAEAGELRAAVAQYRAALDLDPRYRDDPTLRWDLVQALGEPASVESARLLLRERVGSRAQPELAAAAASERTRLGRNARELLAELVPAAEQPVHVRDREELRAARTCPERREVLARIHRRGDPRSLPALVELRNRRRGCGLLGLSDCNACLRPDLAATIEELSRAGGAAE